LAVERTVISWKMKETSRIEQRVAVLSKWAEESAGDVGIKMRYRYNVENFGEDGIVYLHRPAFLNKGCDFIVYCEPAIPRLDGKKFKNPRHQDLIDEIQLILNENFGLKNELLHAIVAIHDCNDTDAVVRRLCSNIKNDPLSLRLERLLKVLKWLFIEQDITDWNTSGRKMLMNSIKTTFTHKSRAK